MGTEGGSKKVYVAFEPTQIKSATGNRGTFDESNPSILASLPGREGARRRPGEGPSGEVPRTQPRTRADVENSPEFRRWFRGSKVVDVRGKPLIVYHGTAPAKSFDVFQSHSLQDVYELDGKEIKKADSWDMGDSRKEMPEGYHYMSIGWAQALGVEEALKKAREEAARRSDVSPDTARIVRDLERMQGKKLTRRSETRPSGDAFYFTPDTEYSLIRDVGLREHGNVLPVYLSIKNPIYLNASQIESAGQSFRVEKYKQEGYDGAIFADDPEN